MDSLANSCNAGRVCHRKIRSGLQRHLRRDLDLAAQMHQKRAVRDVDDLDAVDMIERIDDLFVMCFARGVYGNVTYQKILTDANDIDTLDIAPGLPDRGRDLAEFAGKIVYSNSKCEAVACVGCLCVAHSFETGAHNKKDVATA